MVMPFPNAKYEYDYFPFKSPFFRFNAPKLSISK